MTPRVLCPGFSFCRRLNADQPKNLRKAELRQQTSAPPTISLSLGAAPSAAWAKSRVQSGDRNRFHERAHRDESRADWIAAVSCTTPVRATGRSASAGASRCPPSRARPTRGSPNIKMPRSLTDSSCPARKTWCPFWSTTPFAGIPRSRHWTLARRKSFATPTTKEPVSALSSPASRNRKTVINGAPRIFRQSKDRSRPGRSLGFAVKRARAGSS